MILSVTTLSEVSTIITTLGFPIAVCLILFYYIYQQQKLHKEEVDGLKEEIAQLCMKLQTLTDKIEELVRGYSHED